MVVCEGEVYWNLVLFYLLDKLWLFYKVGSDVYVWKIWFIIFSDWGFIWSMLVLLVNDDILLCGFVKNKFLLVLNGVWIVSGLIESFEWWRVFVDWFFDEGKYWNIFFVLLEFDNVIFGINVVLWDGVKKGMLWECCLENFLCWDGVI